MPKHQQRRKECEDDGEQGDTLMTYNAVKLAVGFSSLVKEDRDKKDLMEKALKKLATKIAGLLRDYESSESDASTILSQMSQLQISAQRTKLPSRLGSAHARDIFERLIGCPRLLNPHEEYVDHNDRTSTLTLSASSNTFPLEVANKDPDHDVDLDGEDSDSEASNACVSDFIECGRGITMYPIYILEYARSPKEFLNAVFQAPELNEHREALTHQNMDFVLECGAKVLVHPDQYEIVVAATKAMKLKPRHVIVSADLEGALNDALSTVGLGIVAKGRSLVSPLAVTSRTFLQVPISSSMRSLPTGTAVASTSDANPRVKFQPRQR